MYRPATAARLSRPRHSGDSATVMTSLVPPLLVGGEHHQRRDGDGSARLVASGVGAPGARDHRGEGDEQPVGWSAIWTHGSITHTYESAKASEPAGVARAMFCHCDDIYCGQRCRGIGAATGHQALPLVWPAFRRHRGSRPAPGVLPAKLPAA